MRIKINRRPRERGKKESDSKSEGREGGGEGNPKPHDLYEFFIAATPGDRLPVEKPVCQSSINPHSLKDTSDGLLP